MSNETTPPNGPNDSGNDNPTPESASDQPSCQPEASQPPAAPPEETGMSDARVGEHEAPAASPATSPAAATWDDEKPGLRARISSAFADIVLWAFVLACLGFIVFDIEVALKHKSIVDAVKAGQTFDPDAADEPTGFLFPTSRMQAQQHGISPYVEFHGQTVLAFVIAGAVIGLLLNLLNFSFIARAYGFGPPRDGPRAPFYRSPGGITGSVVLITILVTGWFVTQIELWKTTDIRRLQYMSGMVARFFNVFGIEKVDTFEVPADLPVPRDAMPPITPAWTMSAWPPGEYAEWTFRAPVAGEYVLASGARIVADAKAKLGRGETPDTIDPFAIDANNTRTIPVGQEFPFAALGLSAGDTVTAKPASVPANDPLIRPKVWWRTAFFRSRAEGDYVFRQGETGPTKTVTVSLNASVQVDGTTGEITEVETANGNPQVPPNKTVPLGKLGMDLSWSLVTAPEGGDRAVEVVTCFVSGVVGRYELNEPPVVGYDGLLLPGRRVSVMLMPTAQVPRDDETNEIALLQANPAWATVQQSPRAWSRFSKAIPVMIETVFLALMATVLAVPIAFVISFLGAQNLMCGTGLGKLVYYCVRTFLNLIRSIEPLCWAIIFGVWVGVGTFAGVLALMVHTIASLAKLYSEQIEGIDGGPVEAITATGASTLKVIRHAVVPQVIPPFISYTMYRWDINVRMAPILGFVGGGGIGMILQQHFNQTQWEEVGVIILLITIVVAAMDIASARIRAKIT